MKLTFVNKIVLSFLLAVIMNLANCSNQYDCQSAVDNMKSQCVGDTTYPIDTTLVKKQCENGDSLRNAWSDSEIICATDAANCQKAVACIGYSQLPQ